MTITDQLAAFATTARPTEPARVMMRLSLFDCLACGIAGAGEPVAEILRRVETQSASNGAASVIGTEIAMSARAAAHVNATTCHALDYDDTHFAHIGHPSTVVVPATLATAQQVGASGEAILDAMVLGVEASIRVGCWLGRSHYQVGFHQTGTAGAFGAAIASSRILGLDHHQTLHALGTVSTIAAGLKSQFGTMGKPLNAGRAAAAGVEAALLSAEGFVSTCHGLEDEQGFGPTHSGEAVFSALDGLGTEWLFEGISHKFHACCHGLHAMLEVLRDAQSAIDIVAVRISTHPRWMSVCNKPEPATGLEAKFSYRMAAAMALAGRDTSALDSYSDAACFDPKLQAMRDRVEVAPDETLSETEVTVEIHRSDSVETMTHDLSAEMPLDVRTQRLRSKGESLLGQSTAERLGKATLGAAPDPSEIATLMRAAGKAQASTRS